MVHYFTKVGSGEYYFGTNPFIVEETNENNSDSSGEEEQEVDEDVDRLDDGAHSVRRIVTDGNTGFVESSFDVANLRHGRDNEKLVGEGRYSKRNAQTQVTPFVVS